MSDLRMPAVNSIIIAGNLTKDPTFRRTTRGTPVSNFPIACSRYYKDSLGKWRDEVCYVGVVAWYKLAESCHDYLSKGSAVMIEGELQSKNLKTDGGQLRNVVEIKAQRIQFLSRKNEMIEIEEETESGAESESIEFLYDPEVIAAKPPDTRVNLEIDKTPDPLFRNIDDKDDNETTKLNL